MIEKASIYKEINLKRQPFEQLTEVLRSKMQNNYPNFETIFHYFQGYYNGLIKSRDMIYSYDEQSCVSGMLDMFEQQAYDVEVTSSILESRGNDLKNLNDSYYYLNGFADALREIKRLITEMKCEKSEKTEKSRNQ